MSVNARTLRLERGLRLQVETITDAQTRDLVRAWADAWTEVEADLRAALLEQLVAGTRISRAQLLRSVRLRKALQAIKDQLQDLAAAAGVRISVDLQQVIDTAGSAQASIIDTQLPANSRHLVALQSWSRVDERQIAAIVARSTEQITSLAKPLSSEAYDALRRELIRGVAAGSNPRETAGRIIARAEGRFNGGLTRALTIARTETLSAHREGVRLGREPHTEVLGGWRWMCDLSNRTCPACLARNGTLHPAAQAGPDGHPNCRCSAVPVTKSWSDLGFEGVEEPPDLFPDARTWFDGLSEADQLAIMGRDRLALLRSGDIGWDDLASLRHNTGWRDSWQVTPVKDLRRTASAA